MNFHLIYKKESTIFLVESKWKTTTTTKLLSFQMKCAYRIFINRMTFFSCVFRSKAISFSFYHSWCFGAGFVCFCSFNSQFKVHVIITHYLCHFAFLARYKYELFHHLIAYYYYYFTIYRLYNHLNHLCFWECFLLHSFLVIIFLSLNLSLHI